MSDISKIRVNGSDYTIKDAEGRTLIATKAPIASPTFTGTPLAPTADSNADNTQIANTAWVNDRIEAVMAAAQAMVYKGTIGTASSNTWVAPAHSGGGGYDFPEKNDVTPPLKNGDTYVINTAATYYEDSSGEVTYACEVGDMAVVTHINQDHAIWTIIQKNIDGAVVGPASSTNNHVAIFNGTTGKQIKDSGYTIQTSVPPQAVFTDQSVTAVGNHYTPTGTTTKSASGATGTSGTTIQVVTGVTMDAKGHVTAVTSGAATDTLNTVGNTKVRDNFYLVGVTSQSETAGSSVQSYTYNGRAHIQGGTLYIEDLNVDGSGTFDGTVECYALDVDGTAACNALTVDGNSTIGGTLAVTGSITQNGTAVSLNGHTHATSIATSSGTNQITLSSSTKYAITAGGTSYIFTTPTDTWRGIQDNLTSSTNTTESLSAKQGYLLANGSARDSTKVPTTRKVNGHALSADITITAADVGAVTTDTKNTVGNEESRPSTFYLVGVSSQSTTAGSYAQSYTYDGRASISGGTLYIEDLNVDGGGTFDGSVSLTGNLTVGGSITSGGTAVSLNGHTHATSIAASTGTNQLSLSANTKYAITAGGTSYVFTTPPWRGIQDNLTSSTNTTESLSAKQGYLLANGSARDSTKVPTTRKVNGKALSADITLTAADVGAVTTDTKNTAGNYASRLSTFNLLGVSSKEEDDTGSYAQSYTYDGRAQISGGTLYIEDLNVDGGGYFDGGLETTSSLTVGGSATVAGSLTVTGAIKKGTTDVTLSTHLHSFTGTQQTVSASFSNKSGATTFLTPTTSTAGTLPTWSASVSSETLSFSFSSGNFPVYSSQGVANTLSGSVTFTPSGSVGAQYYPS